MKMHIIFCGILALLVAGCIKGKDSDTKHTITGRFVQDCSMAPLANQELTFFQGAIRSLNGNSIGIVGTAITDANGNFTFTYSPLNSGPVDIQMPAGAGSRIIMEGLPSDKGIENLIVYDRPSIVVEMRLNVTKPYTSTDTLEITDFNNLGRTFKVAGPFANGIIQTAPRYSFFQSNIKYSPEQNPGRFVYRFNNGPWTSKNFGVRLCDTTRIAVDIN